MDKESLRIVIIAVGVIVIMGMLLWNAFKKRRSRRDINFYDRGDPLDKIDESLVLNTHNDDFDIVPLGSALDDDADPVTATVETDQQHKQDTEQPQSAVLPALIQFSIVARADEGFNGAQLKAAFDTVGLQYGSVKVFERLDDNRMVDFTVASMVDPGIFPEQNLHLFNCPGIVFFMQPRVVDNPATVFEDFIETLNFLATELDGVIWDHQRQLLTQETVEHFRQILS